MGTVNIDRIVLSPFKAGIQDTHFSPASRHLNKIGKTGTSPPVPPFGCTIQTVISQILRILSDNPEITQEMDIQIFKSHLFTFQNQTANLVPDSVPHLKYLPHAAFGTFVVIKTHQPLFQFYRFHHITHRRITAPGNIPPRLENLSYTTGKVPSFSQPGEFSLPDFIGRIGVNTGG